MITPIVLSFKHLAHSIRHRLIPIVPLLAPPPHETSIRGRKGLRGDSNVVRWQVAVSGRMPFSQEMIKLWVFATELGEGGDVDEGISIYFIRIGRLFQHPHFTLSQNKLVDVAIIIYFDMTIATRPIPINSFFSFTYAVKP